MSRVGSTTAEHARRRLLAKRQVDPESGCWLWQGRRDRFGYGRVTIDHRRYAVHRLAAAIYLDFDLESPLQILHRCHTPGCFRPEHLRAGTHAENMRDKRLRAEHVAREPASTPHVKAQRTPRKEAPMARLELTLVTSKVFQYELPKETEADSLTVELLETTGLFKEKWLRVDDRTLINTECVAKVELVNNSAPLAGIFPG